MRARVEREKAASGPFDVKLARGGLMDCEFAAQFLVLSGLGRVAGETTLETLAAGSADWMDRPNETASGWCFPRRCRARCCRSSVSPIRKASRPQTAPEALKRLIVGVADGVLRNYGVGAERNGIASFEELSDAADRSSGARRERRSKACSAVEDRSCSRALKPPPPTRRGGLKREEHRHRRAGALAARRMRISPPCRATSERAIARPRPEPL